MNKINDGWLIIATGSNLGDPLKNLSQAKDHLCNIFEYVGESKIFSSKAVDYTSQPDFFNQVLEFKIPKMTKDETMKAILDIELKLGRKRDIPKGPRTIDIDIIFWGNDTYESEYLVVPHPRWNQRSFVTLPLKQLPSFQEIEKYFKIPTQLNNEAYEIEEGK